MQLRRPVGRLLLLLGRRNCKGNVLLGECMVAKFISSHMPRTVPSFHIKQAGLSISHRALSSLGNEVPDTVDMEDSSENAVTVDGRPSASDFHSIVRVCEILEGNAWGDEVIARLKALDFPFNSSVVVNVLRALSSPLVAVEFFNWLTLTGFEQDVHTYGTAINVLGAAGLLEKMQGLAEEMRRSALMLDADLYEKMVFWSSKHGDASRASFFCDKMKEDGYSMSVSTYTSMFDLQVREEKYEEAVTVYLQMVEEGISPNSQTLASLTHSLLDAGKLEAATSVFTYLTRLKIKPSKETLASLMAACAKVGNLAMLHEFGENVRKFYAYPGRVFCNMLASLHRERRKEAEVLAAELWPDLSAEERLLRIDNSGNVSVCQPAVKTDLLEELGHLELSDTKVRISLPQVAHFLETEGFKEFDQLNVHWTSGNVHSILELLESPGVAWELFRHLKAKSEFKHDLRNEIYMLHRLARASQFSAFKELLCDIQSRGQQLSLETLNAFIKDFGVTKNSKAALWIFNYLKKSNLQADEVTFNNLVQALARDGNPDKALDLSIVMQDLDIVPDIETYTSVIHSLGLAGRSDDTWPVYQRMLSAGCKPNTNTYTVLLSVMDVVGDTGFAAKLFKEMTQNGVEPSEATLGIMANLWQKAGNLVEAQKLETQRKFLFSKKREEFSQKIYEVLIEGLIEQDRSPSLLCLA